MAAADLNAIRATLELHLLAGFGANTTTEDGNTLISEAGLIIVTESPEASPTPLVFSNQAYEPTPNDSFLKCQISFSASTYLSQGGTTNSSNQIDGTIEASIFTPKGVGPGANYDLADRVCLLYTRDILDGIQTGPPSGPSVVAAPQPSAFFQSIVSVPFNLYEYL
jgi:hypothetical protein